MSDPLEEVRRLHLRQSEVEGLELDPFDCLECVTGAKVNMFPLQRTNSFDNATAAHCNCNCSDWMADLDVNDPFGALDDSELEGAKSHFKKMTVNEKDTADNDNDNSAFCPKSTLEELANIFTNTVTGEDHDKESKTNGTSVNTELSEEEASAITDGSCLAQQPNQQQQQHHSTKQSSGEVIRPSNPPPPPPTLANLSPRFKSSTLDLKQQTPERALMIRTTATARIRKQQNSSTGLFNSLNINNHSSTSSGSSTSSSGGSGGGGVSFATNGSSASSSSSSFTGSSSNNNSSSNRSFTATTTSTAFHSAHINSTTTNLSAHSGSLSFNGNLMDPFGDGHQQHRQHQQHSVENTKLIDNDKNLNTPFCTTTTTTSTITIASCLEKLAMNLKTTTTTNTSSPSNTVLTNGKCINENKTQIIDLLKEFDVCFPTANDLDDHISHNSSFLFADQSVSFFRFSYFLNKSVDNNSQLDKPVRQTHQFSC